MFAKSFRYACRVVISVISLTTIAAVIVFLMQMRHVEDKLASKFDFSQYLAIQANQASMLQIYLVVFSLVLAILGFFGFFQLREAAERQAERVAKSMVEQFLKDKGPDLGNPSHPYHKEAGEQKTDGSSYV